MGSSNITNTTPIAPQGFYPEITDCLERAENFWSCLPRRRRILGLWRRSMYSDTSDLAASSIGYVVRYIRSRLSRPKKPSQAALCPEGWTGQSSVDTQLPFCA